MEPNFEKTIQERAVLVGLNADCFTKAQTASDETLEELEMCGSIYRLSILFSSVFILMPIPHCLQ